MKDLELLIDVSPPVETRPGDFFCCSDPRSPLIAPAINFFQKLWDLDNSSTYSHAGLILDAAGTTFEALWTVKRKNLWDDYGGHKLIVCRHAAMSKFLFDIAFSKIAHMEGNIYPAWRIVFHTIPFAAKYISTGKYHVCSELVARLFFEVGIMRYWRGVNPNILADMAKDNHGGAWEILYEQPADEGD